MNITDEELLADVFNAYFSARRNKRNTLAQLKFEINLEANLIKLYEELRNRTYKPLPCTCFITNDPVKREIFSSEFRDRIVHHLLYNYISPIFERRMIYDSYSCRKNKGTLFGIKRLDHHIRSCSNNYTKDTYILKLDLKGYFMSINKQKLYDILVSDLQSALHKKLPSDFDVAKYSNIKKTDCNIAECKVWNDIIDMDFILFIIKAILFRNPIENCHIKGKRSDWKDLPPSKSLFNSPENTGLPIGDLTSQLFSNIYLNKLDNYIKRELKCKHYGRYVDDFYIIDNDKNKLKQLIPLLQKFLSSELLLTLHPKKIRLTHYRYGCDFLGAYIKPYRIYCRNRTKKIFMQEVGNLSMQYKNGTSKTANELRDTLSTLNSYCGYLRHFRTYRIRRKAFSKSEITKFFYVVSSFKKFAIPKKYLRISEKRVDELFF